MNMNTEHQYQSHRLGCQVKLGLYGFTANRRMTIHKMDEADDGGTSRQQSGKKV
jgi:hypothetical protein